MTKKIVGAVVVLGLLGGLSALVWALSTNSVVIGYNKGYAPDQPIPFSHQLHAGQYKIDCRYCHTSVAVSRHASIPSLNVCMNCHMTISGSENKDYQKWIKVVTDSYYAGKSIAWKKVHMLPDFVKFNHAMHIRAGKQCTTCHGPVQEMPRVYQYQSLAMGWCVHCHRLPENHAPTNCSTCHY